MPSGEMETVLVSSTFPACGEAETLAAMNNTATNTPLNTFIVSLHAGQRGTDPAHAVTMIVSERLDYSRITSLSTLLPEGHMA